MYLRNGIFSKIRGQRWRTGSTTCSPSCRRGPRTRRRRPSPSRSSATHSRRCDLDESLKREEGEPLTICANEFGESRSETIATIGFERAKVHFPVFSSNQSHVISKCKSSYGAVLHFEPKCLNGNAHNEILMFFCMNEYKAKGTTWFED